MTDESKKYGLLPTPPDPRDFSLGGVFGVPLLSDLPFEYEVSSQRFIKDQKGTDMCTGYASSAVSEDQEGVELTPFFTFAMTRKIMNVDASEYGADLRSACKAMCQYGALEVREMFPTFSDMVLTTLAESPFQKTREFFADWKNVPLAAVTKASKHKKRSYFAVDGPYDTFDNMRAALWALRDEKRSIFTGINWRPSWDKSLEGVVREYDASEKSYGHAIKIFGWQGTFLKAQLSNGEDIGKKGVFLLSRELVNAECGFGAFTFADMPREEVEFKLKRIGRLAYWFRSIFS